MCVGFMCLGNVVLSFDLYPPHNVVYIVSAHRPTDKDKGTSGRV